MPDDRNGNFQPAEKSNRKGNTTNALILESVVLIAYTFSVWFFASYISTRVEWVWTSEFTYGTLIGLVSWLFMRFASWQRKKI